MLSRASMNGSLPCTRGPSRQNSGSAVPLSEAQHISSRDVSVTDLVRLANQLDADALVARREGSPETSPSRSRSSSVAECGPAGLNTSEAIRRQQASAHALGEAAGGAIAQASIAPLPAVSPQLPTAAVSRQHSGGEIGVPSARSLAGSSDGAGTWLSRVTQKTNDLRRIFDLPASEVSFCLLNAFTLFYLSTE